MRADAAGMMRGERCGHTLTPTALVNEAVARLMESEHAPFNDRAHLLAATSQAMRWILIEHGRARNRLKRGGRRARLSWEEMVRGLGARQDSDLLIDIVEAIGSMERENPRWAQIAQLRLFGERTYTQIAEILGVSLSTVEKTWKNEARPRLLAIVNGEAPPVAHPNGAPGTEDAAPTPPMTQCPPTAA